MPPATCWLSGNTVYGQTGNGPARTANYGVWVDQGASASLNDIYGNTDGLLLTYNGTLTDNRVYDNARYGIYLDELGYVSQVATIIGNVVYSNQVGIRDERPSFAKTGPIHNNLIYANNAAGIQIVTAGLGAAGQQHDLPAAWRRHRHQRCAIPARNFATTSSW